MQFLNCLDLGFGKLSKQDNHIAKSKGVNVTKRRVEKSEKKKRSLALVLAPLCTMLTDFM